MVKLMERRVTRSLSNELQNRGQAHQVHHHHQAQAQLPPGNSHLLDNRANSNCLQPNRGEPNSFSLEPLRTTSEEILIRTLVDSAITQSTPSMDGLGLSSLPLASRRNSEELFSTWLNNQDGPATTLPYWTQQAFGRVSNDMSLAISEQVTGSQQHLNNHQQLGLQTNLSSSREMFADKLFTTDGGNIPSTTSDLNSLQALPWFQQAQPMTRRRSAELRQMYAAMQGLPSLPSADTIHRLATQGTHGLNQAVASLGAFARGLANRHVSQNPQVPQSSNTVAAVGLGNSISNMVSMLRGSLEHKKLIEMNQQNQPTIVGVPSSGLGPEQMDPQRSFAPCGNISAEFKAQNEIKLNLGGNNASSHPDSVTLTRAVSPCESSGRAPTLSTGMALSDGPSNSGTVSTQHNTLKRSSHLGGADDQPSKKLNNGGRLRSPGSHISGDGSFEGFPKASSVGKKPEQLTRVGSLISSGRSDLELDGSNPTKMRRVERREKMLEAKGRPVLPSDLQFAMKRCDALEKEVRSLKLTVSFMNRKDSEQTKRIEELENENQELQREKERLLEEVERLASDHHF